MIAAPGGHVRRRGRAAVWLAWSDGRERALLRAQCREEGWETIAFESLAEARSALERGLGAPRVLLVDAGDAARDPETWNALASAPSETRRIAVASRTHESRPEGVDLTLERPLEIGRVVDAIREALVERSATAE